MRALSPDRQRAIRLDYLLRDERGGYVYSLSEVAARHGVSVSSVSNLARRRGMSRYTTTGRSAA